MKSKFTAVVRQEEDAYVAFTPDLDIASQGADREEALSNLREAVALFLECAPPEELAGRLTQREKKGSCHYLCGGRKRR